MGDPTLILTDSQGHDIQVVSDVVLDLAYGDDENDFTLIIRDNVDITRFTTGSRILIDGTEYGGIVDAITSSVTENGSVIQYSGRTWQGVLAQKILVPDSGQDYYSVSGSVSAVLAGVFSRLHVGSLFTAVADSRPISYRFERFTDSWTGLRKMARASSLKPHMVYEMGRVHVSLRPVETIEDVVDSDILDFTATKNYRRVNHLIGMGSGELKDRNISHWYADANGDVSETQTLFGLDEIAEQYDYNNADKKELEEETKKKLTELQSEGSIEVTLHDDVTLDLGDMVAARDNLTGLQVTAEVNKKIIKIEDGVLSVNYEVGASSTSQSLSGSSESSGGGGTAYTAGDGIDITNHVITAEVTQSELDDVSATVSSAVRQVSDLTADVGAAQQTADSAVVRASSAQSTADSAVSAASMAQTTAEAAQTAANIAIANAQELVANGGFEMGDLTGWTAYHTDGIGVTEVANETHSGNYMLSGNLPTTTYAIEFLSKSFPVVQGRILRCSGWFWNDARATAANISIKFNDGSLSDKTDINSLGDGWKYASADVTVPSGVSSGRFRLGYYHPDSSTVFTRSDDLSVKDITEVKAAQDTADSAISTASSAVQSISAASPLTATRSGNIITLSAPTATSTTAGSMSAVDKAKLDGIDEGANAYTLPAATTSTLGGVKPDGKTITVSSDGTITAQSDGAAVSFIAAWPIGSIYHTSRSTNPGDVNGGTWRSLPSQGGYLWERLT